MTAPPPFDRADASLILRSCDSISFRLHKETLVIASPHFERLLQAHGASIRDSKPNPFVPADTLPTFDVPESSETLNCLFRLIYPIGKPVIRDVRVVGKVLEVAMKYEMKGVEMEMKSQMRQLANDDPVTAYAIACRLKLEPEAQIAAHCAIGKQGLKYVPELDQVAAGPYFRFLEFVNAKVPGYEESERESALSPGLNRTFVEPPHWSPKPSESSFSDDGLAPYFFDSETALSSQFPPDVVLKSSDGSQLRAHRILLSMASPVLSGLLNKTTVQDSNGLPVLAVDLETRLLTRLVSLCYPMTDPDMRSIDDFVELVEVALKFEVASVHQLARRRVLTLKELEAEPLRVYYVCIRYGWHEEARLVAMGLSLLSGVEVYCPEMEHVPAWAYFNIRRYHYRCHSALSRLLHANGRHLRTSTGPTSPGFLYEHKEVVAKKQSLEGFVRSAVKDKVLQIGSAEFSLRTPTIPWS